MSADFDSPPYLTGFFEELKAAFDARGCSNEASQLNNLINGVFTTSGELLGEAMRVLQAVEKPAEKALGGDWPQKVRAAHRYCARRFRTR